MCVIMLARTNCLFVRNQKLHLQWCIHFIIQFHTLRSPMKQRKFLFSLLFNYLLLIFILVINSNLIILNQHQQQMS